MCWEGVQGRGKKFSKHPLRSCNTLRSLLYSFGWFLMQTPVWFHAFLAPPKTFCAPMHTIPHKGGRGLASTPLHIALSRRWWIGKGSRDTGNGCVQATPRNLASPTIWSCYGNISVLINRENNQLLLATPLPETYCNFEPLGRQISSILRHPFNIPSSV